MSKALVRSGRALCLASGLLLFFHTFFVVNTTKSFPLGLYLKTHDPAHRGDLVLVCPEDETMVVFPMASVPDVMAT